MLPELVHSCIMLTQKQLQFNYSTIVIEKFPYAGIKLGVLFFYRRIFNQRKSFRIANTILIVLVALWGFVFFLMQVIVESRNILHLSSGFSSQEWLLLWFAITDVLGDIAILTQPYPCIRKMQMDRKTKVGLVIVFSLGTL